MFKKLKIREKEILSINNITKDFPGVRALDNVSLNLKEGEIHALVGENGAGKSTLIEILSGIILPDKGKISLDGNECLIRNPLNAQKLGISIVFQELNNLVPNLNISQNIFLSHEPLYFGPMVSMQKVYSDSKEILESLKIDLDPNTMIHELSIAQRQMIAITRALSFSPKILLLDEPTSSLSGHEIEKLYLILANLKSKGVSILYVSHRLEEVFEIADRVTVLRDGRIVDTKNIKETHVNDVITKMVGRKIIDMYPKETALVGEEVLRLSNVFKKGICENINLKIRKGEVVGLYGLVGAGRTELARIIFGLDPYDKGEIYIFGKKIKKTNPSNSIDFGIGYLSEDRKSEGLCMVLSVRQNIIRASLKKLFPKGFRNPKKEKVVVKKYINELDIATPSMDRMITFLSGGTQQKVVIAHWMSAGSKILILDEPTRGIDVGTKVEIYKMINRLAKEGKSILLISSDLPEVINMSDRIYVIYKGKVTGEFPREESDPERIVSCAIGANKDENRT